MADQLKYSFPFIASENSEILILGSLPGDRSLAENEYYAHPNNRFWKVIASLTKTELPASYADKKNLLIKNRIALWDVAQSANRTGSSDSSISEEIPNDLAGFLSRQKKIRLVAFNGKKPEKLYKKYFKNSESVTYVCLPSTSPANAAKTLDQLIIEWKLHLNL